MLLQLNEAPFTELNTKQTKAARALQTEPHQTKPNQTKQDEPKCENVLHIFLRSLGLCTWLSMVYCPHEFTFAGWHVCVHVCECVLVCAHEDACVSGFYLGCG